MTRKRATILLMWIGSVALAGSLEPTQEPDGLLVWRQRDHQEVVLQLLLPKKGFKMGESVDLEVAIINAGENPISFFFDTAIKCADVVVTDLRRRKSVPRTLLGRKHAFSGPSVDGKGVLIPPGNRFAWTYPLSLAFDLTLSSQYAVRCKVIYASKEGTREISVERVVFSVTPTDWLDSIVSDQEKKRANQ